MARVVGELTRKLCCVEDSTLEKFAAPGALDAGERKPKTSFLWSMKALELSAFESIFSDMRRSAMIVLGWYQICMKLGI
jgi:hypothetical protein